MKCMLMHKNTEVAAIEINEESGKITAITEVINAQHAPVGTLSRKKQKEGNDESIDLSLIKDWWRSRSIPASRAGLSETLMILNVQTPQTLLTKCFGLSLSDQYWIKPINKNLTWSEVNFFDNPFSDDVGNILFGLTTNNNNELNLCSPDNTSDGCLKKRWKIMDGKRCLVKAGENPFHQQPFNEVIASAIMERLGIPHVSYSLAWIDNMPYSVCENFVTPDTDLVSAWRVICSQPKANHENEYMQYVRLCKEFGIAEIEHYLDMMLVLDYIIANEDRHFGNFGLIRNAETLEWISPAPIFDSGTSLGYNRLNNYIFKIENCKPFKKTHGEQLKLVTSYDWLDFSKLKGIDEQIKDILSDSRMDDLIGEQRRDTIARFVKERISQLERISFHAEKKKSVKKVTFEKAGDTRK